MKILTFGLGLSEFFVASEMKNNGKYHLQNKKLITYALISSF